jgi:DNA-binding MarR family transcriptional regulator
MNHLDATTIAVYRCIERHRQQFGFPPTLREIGAVCYLSTAGVVAHLDKLEAAGYLARAPGAARALTLLKPLPDNLLTTTEAIYQFIVARIEAGEPPSQIEIGAVFHISAQTVRAHLKRLEAAGLIERRQRVSRSILLLKK